MRPDFLTPLPPEFFQPSAREVAPRLLGHWLVRRTASGFVGGPIVETEAYLADDPACHSFGGRSERNQTMWGPPGHAYVYLIYGYHFCVNAVCQPEGIAEAVLIRAVEPAIGRDWMFQQRPSKEILHLTNGPAKLCQALQIDRRLDGADLCNLESPLFIAQAPQEVNGRPRPMEIVTTTRIGITKAADLPLRFYLKASDYVSKRESRRPIKPVDKQARKF